MFNLSRRRLASTAGPATVTSQGLSWREKDTSVCHQRTDGGRCYAY